MKLIFSTLIFILFASASLLSNEGTLIIKVTDTEGNPLSSARFWIQDTEIDESIFNPDGIETISLKEGKYIVFVSSLDYEQQFFEFEIKAGEETILNVKLEKSTESNVKIEKKRYEPDLKRTIGSKKIIRDWSIPPLRDPNEKPKPVTLFK